VVIYLSSLASSADKRRTKALVKNLRHGFLAIGGRRECSVNHFVFFVSGGSGT